MTAAEGVQLPPVFLARPLYRFWTSDPLRMRVILIIFLFAVGYWVSRIHIVAMPSSSRDGAGEQSSARRSPLSSKAESSDTGGESLPQTSGFLLKKLSSRFDHQADARFALGVAKKPPIDVVVAPYYRAWAKMDLNQGAT